MRKLHLNPTLASTLFERGLAMRGHARRLYSSRSVIIYLNLVKFTAADAVVVDEQSADRQLGYTEMMCHILLIFHRVVAAQHVVHCLERAKEFCGKCPLNLLPVCG